MRREQSGVGFSGQGSVTRFYVSRDKGKAGTATWACEGIGRKCLAFSRNSSRARAACSRTVNGNSRRKQPNSVLSARTEVFAGPLEWGMS